MRFPTSSLQESAAMLSPQLLVSCFCLYIFLRLSHFIYKRSFASSPLDKLRGPVPVSFLKGSLPNLFGFKAWDFHRNLAQEYGNAARIKGALGDDFLYVFDPLALHHILLKDQNSFEPSPNNLLVTQLFLGDGLLGTWGDTHRRQRKSLTPVFSAAHMRNMVPLFYKIGQKLEKAFAQRVKDGPQEIDVLSWSSRTALELIAQSGLGYTFDPLTEDAVPHPYAQAAKRLIIVLGRSNVFRIYLLPFLMKIGTAKFRRAMLELTPIEVLQEAREISDLMHETSVKIYEAKKKAISDGNDAFKDHIAEGKDLISILMKNNTGVSKGEKLPDKEIIGQMSTFTFAATDTTSAAIARTLWLLSQRQDVQDKVRAELSEAMLGKDTLSYDEVNELRYLDAVCRELLRLYPPVPAIARMAREDTILPLSKPLTGVDGKLMHEIYVPKTTKILLNIFNCNRNPDLWGPDANQFKPERWSDLPDSITAARVPGVYSNLMTFEGGARSCIGFKFSQLEMKVVLSLLLHKFKFSLPKDKEIYWNMTGITSPCVIGDADSLPPRLPLIVEEAN
ncbi:cytochrome P450 [Crepidotus variabilis]|uniref:Cytochrome P450 n=1 Tax=Crepidotus variabilis TaxID=179855 RepID=A0A9P6ER24_9AGAR|nr:cytochrome P450 [Crepidotus variabilis]